MQYTCPDRRAVPSREMRLSMIKIKIRKLDKLEATKHVTITNMGR